MRGVDVAPKDIPNGVLQSLYDEYLKIHDLKNEALNQCFDEQLQFRILRAAAVTAAPEEAPPPVPDFDFSDADALVVAKDMFKIWSASLGTKKKALPTLDCPGRQAPEYVRRQKGKGHPENDPGP